MKRGNAGAKAPSIDPANLPALPSDVMDDLVDSFNFYDKENAGSINLQQFKNILHNFGFNKLSKKEMDDELRRHEIDLNKRSAFDYDTTKNVVAYRWMKGGGKDEEAKDCFRLFDRRDRGFVG